MNFDPFEVKDCKVVFEVVSVNKQDGNLSNWPPKTAYKDLPRRPMCLPHDPTAHILDNEGDDDQTADDGVPVDKRRFLINGRPKILPNMTRES